MPERKVKHILVSVSVRGEHRWALVAARKQGKHYQISEAALSEMLGSLNIQSRYYTTTLG